MVFFVNNLFSVFPEIVGFLCLRIAILRSIALLILLFISYDVKFGICFGFDTVQVAVKHFTTEIRSIHAHTFVLDDIVSLAFSFPTFNDGQPYAEETYNTQSLGFHGSSVEGKTRREGLVSGSFIYILHKMQIEQERFELSKDNIKAVKVCEVCGIIIVCNTTVVNHLRLRVIGTAMRSLGEKVDNILFPFWGCTLVTGEVTGGHGYPLTPNGSSAQQVILMSTKHKFTSGGLGISVRRNGKADWEVKLERATIFGKEIACLIIID